MSVIVDQLQLQFSQRKCVKGYPKPVGLMFMLMAFGGSFVAHAEAPVTKRFEEDLVSLSAAFSSGGTAITDYTGVGTINDDDAPLPAKLAIGSAYVTEGGVLSFAVKRSGNTSIADGASYVTSGGTANCGALFK